MVMPINDINRHLHCYRTGIERSIARVLNRGWFVLGPEVSNFENLFANYIQVRHCCSVANGTDALELALRASGVQRGDKVATVANAGFYTSTAVLAVGATPLYLDVDLVSRVVTLGEVKRGIREGAKAMVVTHLYGQAVAEVAEIADECRAAGVELIEDCAQAHGASINGKRVGSFGDAGCFSFYPTKNLGALGDGGAVVTNDHALAEKVYRLRQYGWSAKYQVELAGARNSRLDEIQAAILSEFLFFLDGWNAQRRAIASEYSLRIVHPAVILSPVGGHDYVAHLYVFRCFERDCLRRHLSKLDIATDVHYPIPDHRQPVFSTQYAGVNLPNTERLAQEVLTLPCYPEMTDEQVDEVIEGVNSWHP